MIDELAGLPIKWADDVRRGVTYPLHAVGAVRKHDGVSIGKHLVVRNDERVEVTEFACDLPKPIRLEKPPPTELNDAREEPELHGMEPPAGEGPEPPDLGGFGMW